MFCDKCGAQLSDGSKFCANCGAPAKEVPKNEPIGIGPAGGNATVAVKTPKAGASSKKGNGKTIAIVAAVALVALFAMGMAKGGVGSGSVSQSAPAQPTNLEEWVAVNDPDYCTELRNGLLRQNTYGVADISVSVSGNQVNVVAYSEVSSDDLGFISELGLSLFGDAVNDSFSDSAAESVRSLEKRTGMGPITYHYEERYLDGPILASYDFNNQGRIK